MSIQSLAASRFGKCENHMFDSFAPSAWLITLILAVCFAFNFFSNRDGRLNWVFALAVLLWLLYSCWETFFIDPVKDNIRVDLLLIFPVLIVATVVGLIRWLKG